MCVCFCSQCCCCCLLVCFVGFDAHDEDPLASVELIEEDYVWVTREILKSGLRINARNPPKVFSVLEGGYDLVAIAKSAALHVQVLKDGYVAVVNEVLQEEEDNAVLNGENYITQHHNGDEVAALRQYMQELGLN